MRMIKQFLFKLIAYMKRHPVVYNANGSDESNYEKRALLIYVVAPFLLESDSPQLLRHQNSRQCRQIAALLDERGYIVDVVDVKDRRFRPSKKYNLVISNRVTDPPFARDAVRIYLATTLYHNLHNQNLRKRHEMLYKRRKFRVELRRLYPERMPYVRKSHAIVGFGNEFIMSAWRETFRVPTYPFNNYGFKETEFPLASKDFSMARRNFLFFASKSQMQKGLDFLLEIFPKHPDLHLYICSPFKTEKDFCTCYHRELYETLNVHPTGWVRVNGPEYDELVRLCAYVIHPSCSDGQPGSVVQCMYSGLIPLVSREAGIDTEDFGITFSDDSLEEVERVIIEVSQLPESWHRERSIRTRKIAEDKYSEEAFVERWREMLAEILKSASAKQDSLRRESN
jgi:glycosyltransferase involved in cell wall biosynthesis